MKKLICFLMLIAPICTFAKTEKYLVDKTESKLTWTGKKITGEHHGTLQMKDGTFTVEKNKIVGGSFEVDMKTLVNLEVADPEQNAKLVNHLKSEDFFSVEKNPAAKFEITKIESAKGKNTITGNLVIKGISQPISFPAELKVSGKSLTAAGTLIIDRTKWDIKYRSGRFFPELGDKVIRDEFFVDVKLVAKK
jgi:polyisoprenoid-binding protein YceI